MLVSREEAVDGVGLLLEPVKSRQPFLVFEPSPEDNCLPVPGKGSSKVMVSGGVIASVIGVNRQRTRQSLLLAVEKGPYGETSQQIQNPLGGLQEVLSAFNGIESTLAGELELEYQEPVEVRS